MDDDGENGDTEGENEEDDDRKLTVSKIILDVCCVSFCELQKNAVFIGKPKPITKLTRLGTFNSDISANEVMNKISRGERQLGMFVLTTAPSARMKTANGCS